MFSTIRRHQSWLWIVVASVVGISMVIYIGPNSGKLGSGLSSRGGAQFGTINGQPITAEQMMNAKAEVYLRYFLNNNQWPDRDPNAKKMGFDVDRETLYRVFLIDKQKQLGIQISDDAIAERALQVLGGMPFDKLEDNILKPEGLTGGDFKRFLGHELGLQQLYSVAALSGGLVTPQEAEDIYRKDHQELSTTAVFFSASNYLAGVSVTPAAVSQFYNDRRANYAIPNRVQVNYVKYDITNYLADAKSQLTNLDAMVDDSYARLGTNVYRGAKTPEEARAKIREDLIKRQALLNGRRVAGDFASDLDAMTPKVPGNLAELAKKYNLTLKTSEPFDEEDGPQDLNVSQNFTRSAFLLTDDEPFTGAIVTEDGVYVLALKKQLPSEIPALDDIKAKVTADYRFNEAMRRAEEAGLSFAYVATNGLAQGKAFAALAFDAKQKPTPLPPISLSTRSLPEDFEDRVSLSTLKQAAFTTPPGHASSFVQTRDGGFVLYVQAQLPVDEDKVKKELPDFLAQVRQMRQNDAFNQWFSRQVELDPGFHAQLDALAGAQMRKESPPKSS